LHQDKIKKYFDRHTKEDELKLGDLVLKLDARNEDKQRHGKFDHLWMGLFKIEKYHGNYAYLIQEINGDIIGGGPMNGGFLKHYII
jgi:hypothetical protein